MVDRLFIRLKHVKIMKQNYWIQIITYKVR